MTYDTVLPHIFPNKVMIHTYEIEEIVEIFVQSSEVELGSSFAITTNCKKDHVWLWMSDVGAKRFKEYIDEQVARQKEIQEQATKRQADIEAKWGHLLPC